MEWATFFAGAFFGVIFSIGVIVALVAIGGAKKEKQGGENDEK